MRQKRFPKHTMMLVRWDDIVAYPEWHTEKDAAKRESVHAASIGFFLNNHKKQLRLATTLTADNDSDVLVIPWGCITNIEELRGKDGGDSNGEVSG